MIPVSIDFLPRDEDRDKNTTRLLTSEVHAVPRVGEEWHSHHGSGYVVAVHHYYDPVPSQEIEPPMIVVEVYVPREDEVAT